MKAEATQDKQNKSDVVGAGLVGGFTSWWPGEGLLSVPRSPSSLLGCPCPCPR